MAEPAGPPPAPPHSRSPALPPEAPPFRDLPWHARMNVASISLLVFVLLALGSAKVLRGSGRDLDYFGNLARFLGRFFPPDFSVTSSVLAALGETIQIALVATLLAVILSLPLAIAGAQTISPRWLVMLVRLLMNGIRTIPSLIWALIAVAIVGANPLAGVIALTFYSIGYLGKFFSDAFESVDMDVARALRALGARRIQAFQFGVWPHARPLVWSYSLWMLEYNIRSAAIIGYVGAGGLGMLIHTYMEYYELAKFGTVLLFVFGLVTILDLLGERVRQQISRKPPAGRNSRF